MDEQIQRRFRNAARLIEGAVKWASTRQGRNALDDVQIYSGYANDPGNDVVIATGNWNKIDRYDSATQTRVDIDAVMCRVSRALEKMGVEIEWSDEHCSCGECGRLIRTSPDSYGWKAEYVLGDGDITCENCLADDPEEHLRGLEGNPSTANTLDAIDPAKHGYVLIKGDFEHGFHYGQDADPKRIAKALEAQGISRYLFNLDSVGQFDQKLSVYVHEDETELLDREAFDAAETDGPSVAGAMERGLREATVKMSTLEGEGIRMATIHGDGTADVRLVSPEEFIAGVK
jgi:hypothetical protein